MRLFTTIKFLFNQIERKNWFYVILNYFLVLLIALSDIIFLGIFYLLLNKQIDSKFINIFFDNLNFLNKNYQLDYDLTKTYLFLLIFFLVFKNILSLFQNFFYSNFIHNISLSKSYKLLSAYFSLDFESFNKKELSIYVKQILRDVETAFLGIFGLVISFFGEITYIIILLFYLNHLLVLNINLEIIILCIVLLFIIIYLFKKSDNLGKLRSFNEIKIFKTLSDILNIYKELKLNNQSRQHIERFKVFLKNYYKSKIYSGLIKISPKFILEFFAILLFFFLYKESKLDINQFFLKFSVLALAMLRLIPSFARLSYYLSNIFYNINSINFIKYELDRNFNLDKKKIEYTSIENIRLKNVSLSYYSKNNSGPFVILNNFNLFLKKNNIYGIYGLSGSGKTSLLNILVGFIKPQKGKIYYNNQQQIPYKISSKFNISYLSQNPIILDENIVTNTTLRFSNTMEEVYKIKSYLHQFNLDRFLKRKFINDSSIQSIKNMSGGEKQRIAFIRSIMNNPDLLILDEPVSSLDKKNSEIIFKFLKEYKKNKIILVTSHKNSEKKYFDKIFYLNN